MKSKELSNPDVMACNAGLTFFVILCLQEQENQQGATSKAQGMEVEQVGKVDPELLIKHPLQNRWSLWFFKNDKLKEWADNLRVITSFDTIEDFWGYDIFIFFYFTQHMLVFFQCTTLFYAKPCMHTLCTHYFSAKCNYMEIGNQMVGRMPCS